MRLAHRVILRLPKTDIHCHLDGCVRPRTMLELAEAQGVKLPTRNLRRPVCAAVGHADNFAAFVPRAQLFEQRLVEHRFQRSADHRRLVPGPHGYREPNRRGRFGLYHDNSPVSLCIVFQKLRRAPRRG